MVTKIAQSPLVVVRIKSPFFGGQRFLDRPIMHETSPDGKQKHPNKKHRKPKNRRLDKERLHAGCALPPADRGALPPGSPGSSYPTVKHMQKQAWLY